MSEKGLRIAIYANELSHEAETGVKVYSREIIRALSRCDNKNHYDIYFQAKSQGIASEVDKLGKGCGLGVKKTESSLPFWTYFDFPSKIRKDAPDVLFMPIQTVPFLIKPRNLRIVTTVHDVAYLIFPGHFTSKKRFFLDMLTKNALRLSDKIIVPSIATQNDLIRYYDFPRKKTTVIYHGIESCEKESILDEKTPESIENITPYILFVGSIQPRKNIISLIRAFEKMKLSQKTNLKLIICGPKGWMHEETFMTAKNSKFSNDIIFMGNVTRDYLDQLYKNAHIFVMPSFYEGFGLPVVEAMKNGCPCAISKNSSLSEIGDGAVLFFDPYDISDIANKIKILVDNDNLRREYSRKCLERAKKFNWVKSAKQHVDVFEDK